MSNAPAAQWERRLLDSPDLEVRAADGATPASIAGYAAVFNKPSLVMSDWRGEPFREYIAPGAFTKTLSDGADVRALVNHDPTYVLGRTKSGTLRLAQDNRGLRMAIDPPATQWASDLITTMRRGDIDGASFGFIAIRDDWGKEIVEGKTIDRRTVYEARLVDVSVVTFPAYPQSESQVRSILQRQGLDFDGLAAVLLRASRGQALEPADFAVIRAVQKRLQALLPSEPETPAAPLPVEHVAAESPSAPPQSGHPLDWYRAKIAQSEE